MRRWGGRSASGIAVDADSWEGYSHFMSRTPERQPFICNSICNNTVDMPLHINSRVRALPTALRVFLSEARRQRGWSQAELGQRVGLPQMHISGIETGKVVPRFDTLLELVRVLDHDLLLVPRELVPVVQALTRAEGFDSEEERPLYSPDEEERSA
ncbi:MAG: helix-turn-helix transcriptional regulator [Bryobacteraceae bacterium]